MHCLRLWYILFWGIRTEGTSPVVFSMGRDLSVGIYDVFKRDTDAFQGRCVERDSAEEVAS